MAAFITNFQSPVELDDLIDRYERGKITNLDIVLGYKGFTPLEWTVDKDAAVGDTVYFMCAKTSADHMSHLCAVLRSMDLVGTDLYAFALSRKAAYREYAGCIVAVGRIADKPFQTDVSGWESPHWRSPWYAKIEEIEPVDKPINISAFRDFIKVSRTGAITKLNAEQSRKLEIIVNSTNHCGEAK